ncbi:hypothetical protein DPX39_090021500 [Trypanosoma brucei equiperdum]|uniref:Uncharacterized protein n=1 Tax=Trypanosoma brucei equiperdum TaxID=630700 RepID=A0A3L6L1L2_9TRYP|nr:hypothetical protein DPX39_090021500 [Trypanosoma brucei equiperdum]
MCLKLRIDSTQGKKWVQ